MPPARCRRTRLLPHARRFALPILRLLPVVALGLAPPALLAAHPVSITQAAAYVQRDKISVKIDVFVEDLFLFQNIQPNEQNFLEPDEIRSARERHSDFLLERFIIRDAEGNPLPGRLAGIDDFEMPAEGIAMGDLMNYSYGYRLEYPLDKPLEFVTISQQLIDEAAGIPAEMNLRVKQEGSESPYYAVLNPGEPITVRFNWDRPPLSPDASEEAWEKWLAERREETLGITSYSSVYSFVYITDREIRHEILAPLMTIESSVLIPRRDEAFLEIDEQPEAAEQIAAYFASGNPLVVNGETIQPVLDRVDFYGVDFRDFAQRAPQRRVSMASGRAGLILRYPLSEPPQTLSLKWDRFNRFIWNVRSVIYAYDKTLTHAFSRFGSEQTFTWENPGRPPLPAIEPVELAAPPPRSLAVPAVSLACLALLPVLGAALWLGGTGRGVRFVAVSLLVVLTVVTWPLARVSVRPPWQPRPHLDPNQAEQVFERLHGNMYQAFAYHTENDIYDALARSVDGALLDTLYIQVQKGLAMQEQGGAIAEINDVKILSGAPVLVPARYGEPLAFDYQCRWTVEGNVEHWGHIHARTNQYDALFRVAQRDDAWKIVSVELLDEQRVNFQTRLRGM